MMRRFVAAFAAAVVILAGLTACDTTPQPDRTLDLPRVPWAGGPAYWSQFPDAVEAGWTDPGFFPVVGFWMFWADQGDLAYYKDAGVNAFIYGDGSQSHCDLEAVGGVSWIGDPLRDAAACSEGNWPGTFNEDEVDGRYSEAEGKAYLARLRDQNRTAHPDKAIFNNFTGMVVEQWYADSFGEGYVNDYQDASSTDIYFVTDTDYRCVGANWWPFIMPAPSSQARCRDAQSYGKAIDGLRERDKADGKLQPLSTYVENGSIRDSSAPISAAKVKAATISTLIHGAAFLSWFNNSWRSPCASSNVLRDVKNGNACPALVANVAAMREVNGQVRTLAPWLNRQAYQWTFGPGLESRLSVVGNLALWLTMTDGSTGTKTFTLPPELAGVEQVRTEDGRTIPVVDGRYTDTFETNTEYHAYFAGMPG